MKLAVATVCSVLAGLVSIPVVANDAAQAARSAGTAQDSISQAIRDTWAGAKRNLIESAEQMPATDYSFRPTEQVRTFGQILAHVAGANYVFCSPARGEKSPFEEDHFETTAKTKADIVKALNESMAYCDAAFTALTDQTAADLLASSSGRSSARAATLIRNVGHLQEHYGNLVTYFRIKGMVPPSSRR